MFIDPVEKFTFQLRSIWTQISNTGVLFGDRLTDYGQRFVVRRPPTWLFWALVLMTAGMGVFYEVQTSTLQSHIFSYLVRKMTYEVRPGANTKTPAPDEL